KATSFYFFEKPPVFQTFPLFTPRQSLEEFFRLKNVGILHEKKRILQDKYSIYIIKIQQDPDQKIIIHFL
ncbi:hypothetical protein DRF60_19405, partial [Chryseobacterium elymi]